MIGSMQRSLLSHRASCMCNDPLLSSGFGDHQRNTKPFSNSLISFHDVFWNTIVGAQHQQESHITDNNLLPLPTITEST